jgi:hypothetical protein
VNVGAFPWEDGLFLQAWIDGSLGGADFGNKNCLGGNKVCRDSDRKALEHDPTAGSIMQ